MYKSAFLYLQLSPSLLAYILGLFLTLLLYTRTIAHISPTLTFNLLACAALINARQMRP
ncbi:hypothetical protein BDW02DRAFT_129226 [Decorospora gaudefroyi]|uniref:Uncharacterized protein n=1 Tax=Decorospora gaudefroyi TaxID=184978 RepID=A0A6A5KP61_9PLEO|nr:hypothetical protein BDW02DRAFT_129226 [Decorospora gaudefroyi]